MQKRIIKEVTEGDDNPGKWRSRLKTFVSLFGIWLEKVKKRKLDFFFLGFVLKTCRNFSQIVGFPLAEKQTSVMLIKFYTDHRNIKQLGDVLTIFYFFLLTFIYPGCVPLRFITFFLI